MQHLANLFSNYSQKAKRVFESVNCMLSEFRKLLDAAILVRKQRLIILFVMKFADIIVSSGRKI